VPRILHIGLGNFHRAHQACYTHRVNQLGGDLWSITGVSMRSPSVREALGRQGFDYTLVTKGTEGASFDRIDVIDDVLVADRDTDRIVGTIAAEDTLIISLTVTEKGYHLGGADHLIDLDAVAGDVRGGANTIYGLLHRGLKARRYGRAGPLTIMSCDNLTSNGDALARALTAFDAAKGGELADYLARDVTFPNAMVDRITPATTPELIAVVAEATGFADSSPVSTEPFSEWVIEDRFAAARPAWDKVGATMVADVAPFELRKLRLLNGAHSYLAYAGVLAGYHFVHQAIADPELLAGVRGVMAEARKTLPDAALEGVDVYADALIDRFSNPSLEHALQQIAMDGSLKLPVRLVATWADRTSLGLPSPHIEAAIQAWIRFVRAEIVAGRPLDDPKADALAEIVQSGGNRVGQICDLLDAPKALANALA
jgi:fructuronate reductase